MKKIVLLASMFILSLSIAGATTIQQSPYYEGQECEVNDKPGRLVHYENRDTNSSSSQDGSGWSAKGEVGGNVGVAKLSGKGDYNSNSSTSSNNENSGTVSGWKCDTSEESNWKLRNND